MIDWTAVHAAEEDAHHAKDHAARHNEGGADELDYTTLNKAIQSNIEQAIKIMLLEAAAAAETIDYEDIIADVYSDASGFKDTIDTGNTTALYDSSDNEYKNMLLATIMEDDFTDGDYTNDPTWTVKDGGFSAAAFNLRSQQPGTNDLISTPTNITSNADTYLLWEFKSKVVTGNRQNRVSLLNQDDMDGNEDGYRFQHIAGQNLLLQRVTNGGVTTIIDSGLSAADASSYNIKITRSSSGSWELLVDDVSKGTVTDTTHDPSTLSYIHFWVQAGGVAGNYLDDIIIKEWTPAVTTEIITNLLKTESSNITHVQVVQEGDAGDVDISTDNGSNWDNSQNYNEKIAITTPGTQLKIKHNLSTNQTQAGYSVIWWT